MALGGRGAERFRLVRVRGEACKLVPGDLESSNVPRDALAAVESAADLTGGGGQCSTEANMVPGCWRYGGQGMVKRQGISRCVGCLYLDDMAQSIIQRGDMQRDSRCVCQNTPLSVEVTIGKCWQASPALEVRVLPSEANR